MRSSLMITAVAQPGESIGRGGKSPRGGTPGVRPRPRWKGRGFTLIEILVVVAIIGILAVLLVAGFKNYIGQANAARCVSNLKFFGGQAAAYSADNGGAIPIYDRSGYGWQRFLSDYPGTNMNNFQRYVCPEYVQKMKSAGKAIPDPLTIWYTGYAANLFFSDQSGVRGGQTKNSYQNPGLRQQIASPSRTPLFFDNNSEEGNQAYAGYVEDGKGTSSYSFWPAHQKGFNIAFFDGHVEKVKFADGPSSKSEGKAAIDYPEYTWKPY